jgi:hypothetical protein
MEKWKDSPNIVEYRGQILTVPDVTVITLDELTQGEIEFLLQNEKGEEE